MAQAKIANRATAVVLTANVVLLGLKGLATSFSDSLSILSETVNSLTDVMASVAVLICVRMAQQSADEEHPFGHRRAEPIAGLVVAIFAGIMGWEMLTSPVQRLLGDAKDVYIGYFPIPVLAFTMVLKSVLAVYLRRIGRQTHSPALAASAVDCRNDVLVATLALVGVLLGDFFNPLLDAAAAMAIGIYILYQAYDIGSENVKYLMGTVPEQALVDDLRARALAVPGVVGLRAVRAHYVGNYIHVELEVLLDGDMPTRASHAIAERVRRDLETIESLDRAFVHVQPLAVADAAPTTEIPPPAD